jgi:phosphoglucosamine mutase
MCALDYKARGILPHDTLVVTVMSNLGLHEAMRQNGVKVVTTPVGDRHVIEAMRHGGFGLGGEKSGHLIFMDYATTGDGIISALQVLKLMKLTGKTMRELAACMTEYPQALESLPVRERVPLEELAGFQQVLRQCEKELGDQGRTLVRYSGTEKKVRILVEARSEEQVETWRSRLVSAIQEEIGVA